MGKDKKARRSVGLAEDILESRTVKPSGRSKQRRERQGESEDTVGQLSLAWLSLLLQGPRATCSKWQINCYFETKRMDIF